MKSLKQNGRSLLLEVNGRIAKERLTIRFYRDEGDFVCERELVEEDGTSFTMVLPFSNVDDARALLAADPYYPRLREVAGKQLIKLERILSEAIQNGSH